MYSIQKLIDLENDLPIDEERVMYLRRGESVRFLDGFHNRLLARIKKEGKEPRYKLEDIFPILLYKDGHRDDFYSKLVNLYTCSSEEIGFQRYFESWLKYSLRLIHPSFSGNVSHFINPRFLRHPEILAKDFENNIGRQIIFKKFLSTSQNNREGEFSFHIRTLRENSAAKEVWNIFYDENPKGEREVLFNIDTIFRIQKVWESEGIWRVGLVEVAPGAGHTLQYFTNHIVPQQ